MSTSQPLENSPAVSSHRRERSLSLCEGLGLWVATRAEDTSLILQDTQAFSSEHAPWWRERLAGEVGALLDQGYHLEPCPQPPPALRALTRTAFESLVSEQSLATLEAQVHTLAGQQVEEWRREGVGELQGRMARLLPLQVYRDWLGLPPEALDTLLRWSERWARIDAFSSLSREEQKAGARRLINFQRFLAGLLSLRMAHPHADGLSALAQQVKEALSPEELAGKVVGLLVSSTELTRSLVGTALRLVSRNPERWRRLEGGVHQANRLVDEALRQEAPVLCQSRVVTEPVRLGGARLPVGTQVLLVLASERGEVVHAPAPERFELSRLNVGQHLGFDQGAPLRVGVQLARLQARAALEVLHQRLPDPKRLEQALATPERKQEPLRHALRPLTQSVAA
jgi:cytochrome P450